MRDYFWIGVGGALGSMARFACSVLAVRLFGERLGWTLPWGTLFVNFTGSFLVGLFSSLVLASDNWFSQPTGRQFLVVGICGGFTTFSSFTVQTLRLLQNRAWLLAGVNVVGSVVACLAAVWLGHLTALALSPRR